MVRCFQHNSTKVESIKMTFSGFSDLIQSRYGDGGLSNDNSDQVIKQKLTKEGFNVVQFGRVIKEQGHEIHLSSKTVYHL